MWHYVRGLAFSAKGRRSDAVHEENELANMTARIPPDQPLGTSNRAKNVAEIAQTVLAGEIASAKGDRKTAIKSFSRAVLLEDGLVYEEPPLWCAPVRERLAAELLASGQRSEAVRVYRADLRINPGNPRSIFGLAQILRAVGRDTEAAALDREFHRLWRYADTQLTPLVIAANGST
jgi:tetratricopeptide (TPR) repeat protein